MQKNVIGQIRPNSTFDGFEPKTDSQRQALETLKKMAEAIESIDERFAHEPYPFKNARILILSGRTGRGKSHLVEAFINYLAVKAPHAYKATFLSRSDFTLDNIACTYHYDQKPIVVLDDLYAKKQSVQEFNDATDITCLMNFIMRIYEERRLIIMTTNFKFLDEVVARIAQVDRLQRVTSRLGEILVNSYGEIEIEGPDGREEKSQDEEHDLFDL